MKRYLHCFFSFIIVLVGTTAFSSELCVIDTIICTIYTVGGTEIITKSDLDRPSLAGGFRKIDDIIFEKLVLLDAKNDRNSHILTDDSMLESYLANIQKQHNLSQDGLKDVFTIAGYTYAEGINQLKTLQTVNNMLQFKLGSNFIVPRKDVVLYAKEHPVYICQNVFIPFSSKINNKQQKKEIKKTIAQSNDILGVTWNSPIALIGDDIAADRKFITTMKVGDICDPIETEYGFELIRLVGKKDETIHPTDERYKEIVYILTVPKRDALLDSYKKKLFDDASIVYFHSTVV